jgi:hypothetical protein
VLLRIRTKCARQREPTPVYELLGSQNDSTLHSDLLYIKGNNSEECEEEVDIDSEIDNYYN